MTEDFSKHFSKASFWKKVKTYARQIGRGSLHQALILYYVGIDPKTPAWAKGVVAAALGYLIFPLDAIPDLTPFAGYADDAGAIAAALAAIAMRINKRHRDQASAQLKAWFGDDTSGAAAVSSSA
ncbi:MAG: DUF1232 domain-containing protein [Lentisphaerae bacterium]|nr:DUF1232 domain-containing protein [Lentisphaerota bacterium]